MQGKGERGSCEVSESNKQPADRGLMDTNYRFSYNFFKSFPLSLKYASTSGRD